MYVSFNDYLIKVSTYRPVDLDITDESILDIFANNQSNSVYQVFKLLTETSPSLVKGELGYTNVLKRVKRFEELELIEQLKKHFKKGAIHYKISTYGIISYLSRIYPKRSSFLIFNNNSIVIKSLLNQFFESETFSRITIGKTTEYPRTFIYDYLRDCCRATNDACNNWVYLQPVLNDILPSDKVIQSYMSYLGGSQIEDKQYVLQEIKKYDERLQKKLKDPTMKRLVEIIKEYSYKYSLKHFDGYNISYIEYLRVYRELDADVKFPYPIMDLYDQIINNLRRTLQEKLEILVFRIVSYIGEVINKEHYERTLNPELIGTGIDDAETNDPEGLTKRYAIEILDEFDKDVHDLIINILEDGKFNNIVNSVEENCITGFKQFTYSQEEKESLSTEITEDNN